MATRSIPLQMAVPPYIWPTPVEALWPDYSVRFGTEVGINPKLFPTYGFPEDVNRNLWTMFMVPQDFVSATGVRLLWMADAITGVCRWGASIGAISPSDADTPVEHGLAASQVTDTATNTTEAWRLNSTTITIANPDGMAAGDIAYLLIIRVRGDPADTLAVTAELLAATFEYSDT